MVHEYAYKTYEYISKLTNCKWLVQAILVWLGGAVVRALDMRLEVAGSIPAAALSSAT